MVLRSIIYQVKIPICYSLWCLLLVAYRRASSVSQAWAYIVSGLCSIRIWKQDRTTGRWKKIRSLYHDVALRCHLTAYFILHNFKHSVFFNISISKIKYLIQKVILVFDTDNLHNEQRELLQETVGNLSAISSIYIIWSIYFFNPI